MQGGLRAASSLFSSSSPTYQTLGGRGHYPGYRGRRGREEEEAFTAAVIAEDTGLEDEEAEDIHCIARDRKSVKYVTAVGNQDTLSERATTLLNKEEYRNLRALTEVSLTLSDHSYKEEAVSILKKTTKATRVAWEQLKMAGARITACSGTQEQLMRSEVLHLQQDPTTSIRDSTIQIKDNSAPSSLNIEAVLQNRRN